MDNQLLETLEHKVAAFLEKYAELKGANVGLAEENQRLQAERESFKSRIDAILGKLDAL